MAVTNFNTSNQTFRKLMGNGLVYKVPMFQRDYSWSEGEWDDLWQDIDAMLESGDQGHYMGYLVLQTADDRNYDIIDGQQRMTTLSILVLAVLADLRRLVENGVEPDDNKRRIEELQKTYLGYLDPVTLISRSKLTLNRHNNNFFQTYLLPMEPLPRRNLKASEHLLRKSFEWFEERVQRRFTEKANGADLARFIDQVADRLFFTVISVTDELNAFRVFETLNSRGVRLSSTDLLKNYLFATVYAAGGHDHEMRTLEERWEAIIGKLGSEGVPDFLRVFWNSQRPLARHSELFKMIRSTISDKAAVFGLLRDMDRDADIYSALSDPGDSTWNTEQKKHVAELSMFNVRQPLALLMAARRILDDGDFTRVLRACAIISFRYNVIGGLATNEQERVYNAVALKISRGEITSASGVIKALQPIYVLDTQFRSAFSEKQIRTTIARNRKVVRYLLFEIERHASSRVFDYLSDRYSVEHVLPEHPGDGWEVFDDEQVDRCVYRIGNMTPLAAGPNRDLGNSPYSDKRDIYAQSDFELTRRIAAENNEWSPDRISSHQQWLANQATAIWRLSEIG